MKITYSLLPRPHFKSKNLSLLENNKVIGNVENFKIFISIDKLFSFKNFESKDLMNKFLLVTFCYLLLTSCQNVQNTEKNTEKDINKEFTISIEPNLKTNK